MVERLPTALKRLLKTLAGRNIKWVNQPSGCHPLPSLAVLIELRSSGAESQGGGRGGGGHAGPGWYPGKDAPHLILAKPLVHLGAPRVGQRGMARVNV